MYNTDLSESKVAIKVRNDLIFCNFVLDKIFMFYSMVF